MLIDSVTGWQLTLAFLALLRFAEIALRLVFVDLEPVTGLLAACERTSNKSQFTLSVAMTHDLFQTQIFLSTPLRAFKSG